MEASMKARLWLCAAALALLAHAGAAAAQSTVTTRETVTTKKTVRLSPPQRTVIYKRVTQEPRPAISSREVVVQKQTDLAVGSRAPETAGLYDLPDSVAEEVPPVDEVAPVPPRQYKYMVVNDQVLLVDPETSQVVEIIRH
jgi:hypothetical protein